MSKISEIETLLRRLTVEEIENRIATIREKMGEISGRTEQMKFDPEAVLLADKQAALQDVLRKYGTEIDCVTMSIDRIALGVARIQGEEKILRDDIRKLSSKENTNELKKGLDIAQRILAEKKQHGGRN